MLNKRRIRADFSNAADSYDAAAVVQQEICNRALERLQMLKLQPQTILDIGSGTGKSVRGLQVRFPGSRVIASDIAIPMLLHTYQTQTLQTVCCDAEQLSIADNSVDLVFSTSTFQWCENLNQVFLECSRVLKNDGVLVFTTFGPDTLKELRQSWAQVDEQIHVHGFIDMHHIGDLLLANHYADPVVDMELITLEYSKARQLLRDLKDTGSRGKFVSDHSDNEGDADIARDSSFATGLMGKNKFQQFELAYESFRQDNGLLPASYEVIYGYARKSPENKNSQLNNETNGEVRISIDQIK
jgi:malonyl-CoA O-methyltransferase